MLSTFGLFSRALFCDFTNYDDPEFVTANPVVQAGLSWANVGWALTHPIMGNWHPVTTLSHMLDCELFGLNPIGHHFTSIVLHAGNAGLVFLLGRRLGGGVWRSALVAALFAWHPLRVESVAWVAERKDVLSASFGLLTLLMYLRHAGGTVRALDGGEMPPRKATAFWYGLTLVCYALGLLSKAMLVTLPGVFLLLDFWPLRRLSLRRPPRLGRATWAAWVREHRGIFGEKIPFLMLAALSGAATVWTQRVSESVASLEDFTLAERVGNAFVAHARYLGKTFWPVELAVFYPHPGAWPWLAVAGGILLFVGLVGLIWWQRERSPWLLTGWLWFAGMLVPVIGLVQVGAQSMADRYTYLPHIGLFIAVVWMLAAGMSARSWWWRPAMVLAVGSLICCAGLTWRQLAVWRDGETLFRHTLAVTCDNALGHYNLGTVLLKQGRVDEAILEFNAAIHLKPNPDFIGNLGSALLAQGRASEAVHYFKIALQVRPHDAGLLGNLGLALERAGELALAVTAYESALARQPADTTVRNNLAGAWLRLGQPAEAVRQCELALTFKPDAAELRLNLANALLAAGRTNDALAQFERLRPLVTHDAGIRAALGLLLLAQGRGAEALPHLRAAVAQNPDQFEPQYQLGLLSSGQGDATAALVHFRAALRLQPDSVRALNAVAWLLATTPDPNEAAAAEAIALAERAARMTGQQNAQVLDTLAAAYAAAGRFEVAIETAQRALELPGTDAPTAEGLRDRLALYAARQPYRESLRAAPARSVAPRD